MATIIRTVRLTAAESFWYVLGCVWFGGMYLAKVPAKKALSEAGLARMTRAEQFWYVVQCIAFGAGFLLKVPLKKALSEVAYGPGPDYEPAAPGYDGLDRPQWAWGHHAGPRHGRQPAQHSRQRTQLRAVPAQRHARHDSSDDEAW
jgi:hypothetical protein